MESVPVLKLIFALMLGMAGYLIGAVRAYDKDYGDASAPKKAAADGRPS